LTLRSTDYILVVTALPNSTQLQICMSVIRACITDRVSLGCNRKLCALFSVNGYRNNYKSRYVKNLNALGESGSGY